MEIDKLFVSLALDAAKYSQGLQSAQREGASWSQRMRSTIGGGLQTAAKIGGAAILGVGAIIGGVAASGINSFIGFENQMNEVFTLLPGISEDAMDSMSDDVLKFSKDFAVLPEEVVPALYQSLSAGVPPDNVFSFLETAQKAAVGGVTDLETAVDGISSVVNAYGADVLDATNASDVMFTAVRLGKTDFTQLSSSLFNVIPTAASLGVGFGDVAAQLATLTAQGTPTSVATTQIRSAMVEASKSGSKLSDAIENLTGSSFAELIDQGQSMPEIFNDLRASMSDQEFKDLFGSVEAMNAALGITGSNFDTVSDAMDEMNSSAGATNDAYDQMNGGIKRTMDRFRAFASTSLIQVVDALSPVLDKVLSLAEQALPYVEDALNTVTGVVDSFFGNIEEGMTPLDAFIEAIWDLAPKEILDGLVQFRDEILPGIVTWLTNLWVAVQPVVQMIQEAIAQFVSWQDVMVAVGVVIGAVVLNAIAGIVAAMAPVIVAVGAVIGVISLLRNAWENDWGGIRTSLIEFWETSAKPALEMLWQWLGVNVPIALEQLRAFWVDTAWPAIQAAMEIAWAIVQEIFRLYVLYIKNIFIPTVQYLWDKWVNVWWPAISKALKSAWNNVILPLLTAMWDFITNTVVPTVQNLWDKWVNVWWPAISSALSDAWNNVILPVLTALWDFITNTIVPTVQNLWDKWVNVWWPAISKAIEDVWAVIQPIWEKFREYIEDTLPPALEGLRGVMETVMAAISSAVEPVKSLWDGFVDAVTNFWDWITNHSFDFNINLPELPDWAVPGSPLPIHTAWKNFAEDMKVSPVEPRFDLSGAAGLVGAASGSSTSYSSETTVQLAPGQDPLRALQASRHLDKLGRSG